MGRRPGNGRSIRMTGSGCWPRSPIVSPRGSLSATEYRLLAKSGRVVWFRDEARVVYDPEGQFLFLQGLALDITERKRAEDALRQTTQTLQTLIQASPLAIITLDLDLKVIRLWNPGAERMFGWKESEVLGGYLPCVPDDQLTEEDSQAQAGNGGKGAIRPGT